MQDKLPACYALAFPLKKKKKKFKKRTQTQNKGPVLAAKWFVIVCLMWEGDARSACDVTSQR